MSRLALDISGMTCAACSARVAKALSNVDGVKQAEVNLPLERASIEFDGNASPEKLIAAVEKAGYGATLRLDDTARQHDADNAREAERAAEERRTLLRVAISAVLTVPLVAAMVPMLAGSHATLDPWLQAALAAGVMAVSGTRFYREAFAALRGGGANMAVLVSLGTTVAFVASLAELLRGNMHAELYFEATAVVLTLVMLGKYLEARARRGASAALATLGRLQPSQAERLTAEGATTVPVSEIKAGDRILVRPGSRFPADGTLASGHSSIDESLVTGESLPVERAEGDPVLTGTINGETAVEVIVTRVGADTRLARMARLVEEAQGGQAPIQRLVDRISAVFVPVILVVAAATFLFWWLYLGDLESAVGAAVAVLVIACPCALGLATPTALVAGTGAAAKAGILIRDIETLERAEGLTIAAFDKTGTLTLGRPAVVAVHAMDGDEADMLRLAAAIEARSEHPLGKALVALATERGLRIPSASNVEAKVGRGLTGLVEGRQVAVGNARMADEMGRADHATVTQAALGAGGTVSFVAVDGRLLGGVRFADEPRPEATAALAALKARGLRTMMLTGDNEAAAKAMAERLGLSEVRAGLLPEEKIALVKEMSGQAGQRVLFVGDGVNDGPALAAARLGIALSSGADVAREAAAVTLMRPDLMLVPAALDVAERTRRTIRINLVWAFIYNIIGIPLAAAGMLSPMLAGAAMAFSSVSVVTNSALLARWRAGGSAEPEK